MQGAGRWWQREGEWRDWSGERADLVELREGDEWFSPWEMSEEAEHIEQKSHVPFSVVRAAQGVLEDADILLKALPYQSALKTQLPDGKQHMV